MSNFTSIIIKTFENLIKLNDVEIVIIYDKNNKLWFSLRDVFKALDYMDIKKEIKRLDVENKHLMSYGKIYNELSNNTQYLKKHPQTVMIDEGGIYKLLDKSNKPIAKQFRDELFSDIIPELRDKGEFKFTKNDRKKLENIKIKLKKTTQKLHLIKKSNNYVTKQKNNTTIYLGKDLYTFLK
jgi:prophage antirepressor-like protein